MKKVDVIVDVLTTEDGYDIYAIQEVGQGGYSAYLYYEDGVDEYVEENNLNVVADYR